MNSEVVDAEAVGEELELRPDPATQATLFRTDDPVQVIEKAAAVADALKGVLTKQGLTSKIKGRDHVRVEGWTTLGSMLGVVPVVEWTRKLEGDKGWEARVEARTLDGRVVGAAEAECLRSESTWSNRDDYALRSMAQTRATSKALRGPLGFVVTLAGFAATPAEEMPQAGSDPPHESPLDDRPMADGPPTGPAAITIGEATALLERMRTIGLSNGEIRGALSKAGVDVGDKRGVELLNLCEHLTPVQASVVDVECERIAEGRDL